MEKNLSDEDRKWCEDLLKKYESYDDDYPIMLQLDGEDKEPMRGMATIAKHILLSPKYSYSMI